jgi:protease-4
MNTFFKAFFATLLALFVFSIIVLVTLGGVVTGISKSLEKKEVALEPNSVLVLDLNYDIPEQTHFGLPVTPFGLLDIDHSTGLNDILKAIDHAKTDPNIKGILIKMGVNINGYATLEEIRNALHSFEHDTDKFVLAYGEYVNQSSYYLGSVADEVYLNPAGALEFKGLAAQLIFIKGTLDKLGIQTQVFWAGEFKSATEPLRLNQMSEQNRRQTREYIDGLYGQLLEDMAVSRKMSSDSLRSVAYHMSAWYPPFAVSKGLLNGLMYEDELLSHLTEKLGLGVEAEVPVVSLTDYIKTIPKASGNWDAQIAVVYAEGSIVDGEGENGAIGSINYREIFAEIRKDPEIKAVVIRVNSGGGSALASEVLWREISILKKEKPVVVSMGDYAASGGYMMACNASKIYAQPNTLTGSIGVFLLLPEVSAFMQDKLGMTTDTVLTGLFSDFPTISRPANAGEAAVLQAGVDSAYLSFKQLVAAGRGKDMETIESVAKGRVWLGSTARDLGLIDELGGLQDAVDAAVELAKLEDYRITEYPQQEIGFWEEMVMTFSEESKQAIMGNELGALFEPYRQVRQYLEHPVIRAEIPYLIQIK